MASPSSIQGAIPWRRCIRPHALRLPARRPLTTSHPFRQSNPSNPLRSSAETRAREHALAQSRRSITLSAAGIAACAVAMYGVIHLDLFGLEKLETDTTTTTTTTNTNNKKDNNKTMLDGPAGFTNDTSASSPAMILQGPDGSTQVETGTSSVPYFPSTMRLPTRSSTLQPGDTLPAAGSDSDAEEEYQLLGLGIRTVSFLRIQVYVVGLYIATKDLPELQQRLVRTAVNPPKEVDSPAVVQPTTGAGSVAFATSLVPGEREALKKLLLDEERGDAAWSAVLREGGLRTAWRVVPTRNTDFLHLRDGWVRGLAARAQKYSLSPLPDTSSSSSSSSGGKKEGEFADESFGRAVGEFKALFGGGGGGGKKGVSKGQTLVLVRDADGALEGLVQAEVDKPGMRFLGRVSDERISRLVWLNYLAGKNVSSEGARRNVVDGVMGVVERPVGTI
ncbi:chalcone-flavanone isomerase-domain-containing protein [Aspergillus taichungensis]|uniref:Chalcone-flavanone isomerase-domain-containing protein n=1 Tax=Aspergillus taichungensis TaxID=482145 RepID=A0A2J5HVC4_9EURO|nr:chalcone-flavanone isomerase-domain-containing protein [Aspergillus taichungensis]